MGMKNLIIALGLGAALSACAVNANTAQDVLTGYLAADAAITVYAGTTGASPTTLAAMKSCEAVAWVYVGPIASALAANQTPPATTVTQAQDAVATLVPCLDSLGLKL